MVTSEPASGVSLIDKSALSLLASSTREEFQLPKLDIAIVEDDESVREATDHLLRLLGYITASFGSAEDFLNSDRVRDTACLITDVACFAGAVHT